MPKKNGKVAQKPQAEAPAAPAAPAEPAAAGQDAQNPNNAWMDFVRDKLLHPRKTGKQKDVVSVSFPYPNSPNGYASFLVNPEQLYQSTRKDEEGNTVDVEGYHNVLLGDPDKTRKVSVPAAEGGFSYVNLTNEDIMNLFNAERAKYRAAKKAERLSEREIPETDSMQESVEAQMGE